MDKYRMDLFVQSLYKENKPLLQFDPNMSKEEFFTWKEKIALKAFELLQYPDNRILEPKVRFVSQKQREGYRIEKYEIQPEPNCPVPFLLLIPDGADKEHPVPAVMCCPGSATPKESLCGEDFIDFFYEPSGDQWRFPFANAQALHFVRRGMVAVATENPGTGEQTGAYDRNNLSLKLIMKGRNYVGLGVMYRQAILNWVKNLDYVDRNRIGLSGHSLGTESTMFLALLDKDVKAVVHNDFVSDNNQRIISCYPPADFLSGAYWHMVPDMHKWLTFPDLLAAFAPGKLYITEGGVTADLDRIGKAYEMAGVRSHYQYTYYPEFQEESARCYDHIDIPENLSMDEYFKYANVNAKRHFYKYETAVPWMVEALMG